MIVRQTEMAPTNKRVKKNDSEGARAKVEKDGPGSQNSQNTENGDSADLDLESQVNFVAIILR